MLTNAAAAQNCPASSDLPNLGCVNSNLYRGAQPTQKGIEELARRGVKTIISLRNDDENADLEKTQVRNAGMTYLNVPLENWRGPQDEKIAELMSLLNASENQPVFIHCKRGADRTGTVIAVYRISHDDWTAKQANEEAKSFKFGWWQVWMKDYINDYYRDYHKQKVENSTAPVSFTLFKNISVMNFSDSALWKS